MARSLKQAGTDPAGAGPQPGGHHETSYSTSHHSFRNSGDAPRSCRLRSRSRKGPSRAWAMWAGRSGSTGTASHASARSERSSAHSDPGSANRDAGGSRPRSRGPRRASQPDAAALVGGESGPHRDPGVGRAYGRPARCDARPAVRIPHRLPRCAHRGAAHPTRGASRTTRREPWA